MPLYTLLLRDPAVEPPGRGETEWAAMLERFIAWSADLDARDKLRGVERLDRGGVRVVRKDGGRIVVDGPFPETKETVLGFFVIEAATDDEAVAIAAETPSLDDGGTVELRAIADFPQPRAGPGSR